MGQPRESATENDKQGIPNNSPPINRRFWLTLGAGVLLIPACEFGSYLVRKGRNVYGRLLIGSGFGLFWGCLLILFLSGFRWSWGWWL